MNGPHPNPLPPAGEGAGPSAFRLASLFPPLFPPLPLAGEGRGEGRRPMQSAVAAVLAALALTACVTTPTGTPPLNEPAPTPPPAATAAHGEVIARNDRLLIYVPVAGESLRGIAARLLGSEDRDWQISEANAGATKADPGQPLIVPLTIDGIAAGDTTYGHRFLSPGAFQVRRFDDYVAKLEKAKVVLDPARRREIILADANVKAVLVNIFGGIMRCDIIAEGIIAAVKEVGVQIPVIVRLEGTNVDLGKQKLKESGLAIITADDLNDAAQQAVRSVK